MRWKGSKPFCSMSRTCRFIRFWDFLSDLLLLLPERLNQLVNEESRLRGVFFVGCGSGEFLPALRHSGTQHSTCRQVLLGRLRFLTATKNGPIGIGPKCWHVTLSSELLRSTKPECKTSGDAERRRGFPMKVFCWSLLL